MPYPPKPNSGHDIKVSKIKSTNQDEAGDLIEDTGDELAEQDTQNVKQDALETELIVSVGDQSQLDVYSDGLEAITRILGDFTMILDERDRPHVVLGRKFNAQAFQIGTRESNSFIRRMARKNNIFLKRSDLANINDWLIDHAEAEGVRAPVYLRVAPIQGGVLFDLGGDDFTRVKMTGNGVEILEQGADVPFSRSPTMLPMTISDQPGDYRLIEKYLPNLRPDYKILLIVWIVFVITHAKIPTTSFPILALIAEQGSGKTTLARLVQRLTDDNAVGPQVLLTNAKDMAIATRNAHVVSFDNLRGFRDLVSDLLAKVATGAMVTCRQLYTDDEMSFIYLHAAIILNGIYEFVNQPDLAQRSLFIKLDSLDDSRRMSEADMELQLETDLPIIRRGLFDLAAEILRHLPDAEVVHSERMIDYVRYLAAMELVDGVNQGTYQGCYHDSLIEAQRDALLQHPLPAALIGFSEELRNRWKGEPTKLLEELSFRVPQGILRSNDWPNNAIQLSKRIKIFQSALKAQGVFVEFGRGKSRTITINTAALAEEF